jgi:hypothetical protein
MDFRECEISLSSLNRSLKGVFRSQEIDSSCASQISAWVSAQDESGGDAVLPLHEWRTRALSQLPTDSGLSDVVDLALGTCYLRYRGREFVGESAAIDTEFAWSLIRNALSSPLCHGQCTHSPQGFISVNLCSLMVGTKTDELYRLHVWLPRGDRADSRFRVHSHQPFAQSWILAGEATDEPFLVQPVEGMSAATHAKYKVVQNFQECGESHQRRRVSSTISSSGEFVKATPLPPVPHTRGMTYNMLPATFHASEVAWEKMHVTLFFFDSHRGFVEDAAVLGPKESTTFTNVLRHQTLTPTFLKEAVDDIMALEKLIANGKCQAERAEWKEAQRQFDRAHVLCRSSQVLSGALWYRYLSLRELAYSSYRLGNVEEAKELIEDAVKNMSPEREDLYKELRTMLRQMSDNQGLAEVG